MGIRQRSRLDPLELPLVKWSSGILLGSTVFVLLATLTPFDFSPEGVTLKSAIQKFFDYPSDLRDVVSNIILFLPFGIGVTCRSLQKGIGRRFIFIVVLVASALLSLSVETLQSFLPARYSSWVDICTNTTGGGLGALLYFVWCATVPGRSRSFARYFGRMLSVQTLALALIVWVIFTGSVSLSLQKGAQLNNWDTTFPLILGNEQTGDRPWKGTVSALEISDRAIPPLQVQEILKNQSPLPQDSLIAAYSLVGRQGYRDRTGNLPDIVQQGVSQSPSPGALSQDHWLSTQQAATALSQKLRQSSEFTLSVIAATADRDQTGPARIVSLSADPFQRNFTLGQERQLLVFRLRTPITGENGTYTALFVPNVFRDTKPHRLIFTYQHSVLRAYVDQDENSYSMELTPEITLFRYLFPYEGRILRLNRYSSIIYYVLFYSLFFLPLGLILALLTSVLKGQFQFYLLLSVLGIVIPALLLQLLLRGDLLRIDNIVMSITIALATMLVVRQKLIAWLPVNEKSS